MHRVGHTQNPSLSRLSPSESVHLRVRYHGSSFASNADIHHDEVVKAAQPRSSSRRGIYYAFSNRFFLADLNFFALEWSHSYTKFRVVLVLAINPHAGVRIRILRSSCIFFTWVVRVC